MNTATQHLQLIEECNQWYEVLANYKEKLNNLKNELYRFAPGKEDKQDLVGIEHFHNQFHIQLINVHDLKHSIRRYVNETDQHPNFPHRIPHHFLKEKVDSLIADLEKLEVEFHAFINR